MATLKSFGGIVPTLKQKIVDVPELGEDAQIIVREMSSRRMANYQKAIKDIPSYPVEHLIVACCVDEDGNQIAAHEDVLSISEMLPGEVAARLIDACKEVNASVFQSVESKKKK